MLTNFVGYSLKLLPWSMLCYLKKVLGHIVFVEMYLRGKLTQNYKLDISYQQIAKIYPTHTFENNNFPFFYLSH